MHNTDRTQQFMESGEANFEGFPQSEFEAQYEGYPQGEYQGEYQGEFAGGFQGEMETQLFGELVNPATGEINQELEMNLAAELLTVSNEAELDQFLGKLIRGVGRGFRRFARSGFGRFLGGALRNVARAALPTLGGALGSLIPIPGVGTALGAAAGNAVGGALGLEFEGLSNEDREFEIARRIVRIGIESGRALDGMQEGEFVTQQELGGLIGSIAGRILPSVGRAVLGGLTGQAASGGQATGGLSGGVNVSSPGGWNLNLGGQAGGQVTGGTAVGINARAPNFPFQPSPPSQVLPYRPGMPGPRPSIPGGIRPGARMGRWIRRGRHIIVLNAL